MLHNHNNFCILNNTLSDGVGITYIIWESPIVITGPHYVELFYVLYVIKSAALMHVHYYDVMLLAILLL